MAVTGPAGVDGGGESRQDKQDGLLPVVNFLQSALAMKAKVRVLLQRTHECFRWRLWWW